MGHYAVWSDGRRSLVGLCQEFLAVVRIFVNALSLLKLNNPPSVRYFMPIPLTVSFLSINIVRAAVNRLNSNGARAHPCRTPVRIENGSVSSPYSVPLHNCLYKNYGTRLQMSVVYPVEAWVSIAGICLLSQGP